MPPTVLVVEDNPITRKVVELALGSDGFAVVVAETASDALASLDHCCPDLVLQDIALGDDKMDGIELAQRLRSRTTPGTPIVAFTGYTDEAKLRAAGFTDVLVKPVEPSRLLRAIHRHLDGRSQEIPTLARTTTDGRTAGRAWKAFSALLSQLTEITNGSGAAPDIVSKVLASYLHASGISAGFAYTFEDGDLVVRTQLGFDFHTGRQLAERWRIHRRVAEVLASRTPHVIARGAGDAGLFDDTEIGSVLLVPLVEGDDQIGLLALASVNAELAREWLDVGAAISGMVTQAIRLAMTVTRLAASEHKFRGIAESTADGIVVTNMRGKITYANSWAEQLIGISTPLVGRRIATVFPHLGTGTHHGRIRRGDSYIPIETTARCFEDPPGELSWVYVVRDLSERNRLVELADTANRDPLTGMFNRRRFHEELITRIASVQRYGTPSALVLIDLDDFKPINDLHGHAAGDAALQEVAQVLHHGIRDSDFAARLGGDEFAVLLDHSSIVDAEQWAIRQLEQLRGTKLPCSPGRALRASIGVAEIAPGTTIESVMSAADEALYRAKRDGRGCVRRAGGTS